MAVVVAAAYHVGDRLDGLGRSGWQSKNLTVMALAAVMLGFSSATQDIVIDAYRIESAEVSLQALLAAMYIAGYRVGMLVAGAGSLFLAGYLGTTSEAYNYTAWQLTYLGMAAVMVCGVVTTLADRRTEAWKPYISLRIFGF